MKVPKLELQQCAVHFLNSERGKVSSVSDSRYYNIRSNLGSFNVCSFMDALCLAKEIFTVPGCWALISALQISKKRG